MPTTLTTTAEVLAFADLPAADIAAWEALQNAAPEFSNPLFGPRFSRAVAAVRSDVRVAVYRRGGGPFGFLPFHKRPGGLARPIGAPFSDYQGLVSNGDIGISGAQALSLAGIKLFRANGLVDPFGLFRTDGFEQIEAFAIEPGAAAEAYLEALRAGNPKRFKNFRRLENRLEREVGPLTFVADDRSPEAFEAVMRWKREQFQRTGLQDVLRPDWVSRLMADLFATREGAMTGQLSSLYAGGHLVAGHFGPRQGGVFHPWIASTNPEFVEHSPGQAYVMNAIRAMPASGLVRYDLASGHDHYKRPFGPVISTVLAGTLTSRPGAGPAFAAAPSAVRKVFRRLDHIAALNPTLSGRARGLAEAAMATTKRGFGNASSSEGVS